MDTNEMQKLIRVLADQLDDEDRSDVIEAVLMALLRPIQEAMQESFGVNAVMFLWHEPGCTGLVTKDVPKDCILHSLQAMVAEVEESGYVMPMGHA